MTLKLRRDIKKFLTACVFYGQYIALCLMLSSCAGTRSHPAPVIDRTELPTETQRQSPSASSNNNASATTQQENTTSTQYEVVKGDTLYAIGKKLGIPHQKIAEANNIQDNTIYVGQILDIPGTNNAANNDADNGSSQVVTQPLKSTGTVTTVQKPTMVNGVPQYDYPKATRDTASENAKPVIADTNPSSNQSNQTKNTPSSSKVEPAKNTSSANNNSRIDIDTLQDQNIEWRWPANGKLLAEYDKRTNKGIDIGGSVGQPILAASTGKVIYSGTDIRGYGKLVIIKHNRNYLSVYAHRGNNLVKEGQFVNLNEKVAEMGRDNGTVKVHFEIRRKGKTVDPKEYLPAS